MTSSRAWSHAAGLLILLMMVCQLVRILTVTNKSETSPFLSANDRSRWCTVAALVEYGGYEIDPLLALRDDANRRHWNTIDRVRHLGPDGQMHDYSSKPPLLSFLVAWVYRGTLAIHGQRLTEQPYYVARWILVLVNGIPLLLYGWWCRSWIQQACRGLWAKSMLMLFACFGTLVTAYGNTLSNHLQGAMAVALSLFAMQRVLAQAPSWQRLAWSGLAGMATAFAASCDLPALSWLGLLGLYLLVQRLGREAIAYGVGILPIAILFASTNYQAHREFSPAYAHRGPGKLIATLQRDAASTAPTPAMLQEAARSMPTLSEVGALTKVEPAGRWDGWRWSDESGNRCYAVLSKEGQWEVCLWDDWYDYPGSYWRRGVPAGVDQGEPSLLMYAFHVVLGHHGILSLTPMWLIAMLGWWINVRSPQVQLRHWAYLIGLVTVVCLTFYLSRPMVDRNYGGVNCGFRWAIWMMPLWLIMMPAGLNALRRYPLARRVSECCLAISLFTTLFAWSNPWVHPWLYQYLLSLS